MKDPSGELLTGLYGLLNGNVTYNSETIPVYTRVVEYEDLTAEHYIQIGQVSLDEDGPKDGYASRGQVEIYVDTFFTGRGEGSQVPMNNISSQVGQLLDVPLDLTSFEVVVGRVSNMDSFEYELDDQGTVFRKLITYSFLIEEL